MQKIIQNPISKFEKLQPEIIYLISEFLTFDQYLELRLINHFMNRRIQYISILKVQQIKSKIDYFELQLEEQVISNENYTYQEGLWFRFLFELDKLIYQLDRNQIFAIKPTFKPLPLIVQQIFEYAIILGNCKSKDPLQEFTSFLQTLNAINISNLTQSQLQRLTPILQISVESAQNYGRVYGIICEIIQLIIKAHNSCQLKVQFHKIGQEIKKNQNNQVHLDKLFGLNNK